MIRIVVGPSVHWVRNYYGQSTPPSGTFLQVNAGSAHNCGLTKSGSVKCWGWNKYGACTPL